MVWDSWEGAQHHLYLSKKKLEKIIQLTFDNKKSGVTVCHIIAVAESLSTAVKSIMSVIDKFGSMWPFVNAAPGFSIYDWLILNM